MNDKCFEFGEFFLDPTNRLLRHGEAVVSLSPKAFDALLYLARNPGRLLTREELMQAIWPDSFVEEGNLSVHIFQIRRALGAAPDGRTYIQTVPKKGYRFSADIKVVDQSSCDEVALPLYDPETTKHQLAASPAETNSLSRARPSKLIAGLAALVAVAVIAGLVLATRKEARKSSSPVRLTSFSPELSVTAAALSPDGQTLAYANPIGLFLEETATKETRRLHSPAPSLRISNLSWFPDGGRLLVTGAEPDALTSSVWIVPAKGMTEPERVGAFQRGVISPDASQLALVRESGNAKELLLLPVGGGQPRSLAAIPAEEALGSVFWSRDGDRLQFVTTRWNAQLRDNQGVIRSVNLSTADVEEIFSAANLSGDAISLPDGRIVYGQLLGANPAGSYGGELRQIHVDPRTDHVVGDSVSLGRWTDQVVGLSTSADGRRLVFRTVLNQHSVYAGDLLDQGKSLARVRRLTLGQGRDDFPRAWTPDSQAVFFDSNRNGKWEVFKQSLDQIADESYLQGADDEFSPAMSPDGRYLLYLDRPREWREPAPVRLMRVSTAERFPHFVLQTSGYSEWGLRFQCARIAAGPCILAQRMGAEIVFRQFDSERGFPAARNEVLRIPLDPNLKISWALAPDGSRLAWIVSDAPDATIHIASLQPPASHQGVPQSPESEAVLKGLSHLHALNWASEREAWYVTTRLPASWKIVYASGARNQTLLQGQGEYSPEAWPSPDGLHLAFSQQEQNSNVWMLENF